MPVTQMVSVKLVSLAVAGLIATSPIAWYPHTEAEVYETPTHYIACEKVEKSPEKADFIISKIDKSNLVLTEVTIYKKSGSKSIITTEDGNTTTDYTDKKIIEKWRNPTPEKLRRETMFTKWKNKMFDKIINQIEKHR